MSTSSLCYPPCSRVKVLLEWIQFWYDMVTLFVQKIYKKKPERKICSESKYIDENDIVQ